MPCSPWRMSRRCRPQGPDLGALPSSTGNPSGRKPRPFSVDPALVERAFVRTARRYRAIEIRAAPGAISAADSCRTMHATLSARFTICGSGGNLWSPDRSATARHAGGNYQAQGPVSPSAYVEYSLPSQGRPPCVEFFHGLVGLALLHEAHYGTHHRLASASCRLPSTVKPTRSCRCLAWRAHGTSSRWPRGKRAGHLHPPAACGISPKPPTAGNSPSIAASARCSYDVKHYAGLDLPGEP